MNSVRLFTPILLFAFAPNSFATPMTKQSREVYIKNYMPSCVVRERLDPISKVVPDVVLNDLCACKAIKTADLIATEDLLNIIQNKNMAYLFPILEAVNNYCVELVFDKYY